MTAASHRAAGLVALALLSACTGQRHPGTARAPGAGDAWIAGTWIPVETPAERDRRACAGDVGIRFRTDGAYEMLEEAGRWRLEGDRLTMTPARGRPEVARLRRRGAAMVLAFADGHSETLARCP